MGLKRDRQGRTKERPFRIRQADRVEIEIEMTAAEILAHYTGHGTSRERREQTRLEARFRRFRITRSRDPHSLLESEDDFCGLCFESHAIKW